MRKVKTSTNIFDVDGCHCGGGWAWRRLRRQRMHGFESVATVTFRAAGRVEMGGKVELVMPSEPDAQYGWRFTDGAPMSSMETSGTPMSGVVFVASGGVSTPTATAVGRNVSTRRLVFTVAAHGCCRTLHTSSRSRMCSRHRHWWMPGTWLLDAGYAGRRVDCSLMSTVGWLAVWAYAFATAAVPWL